MAPQDAAWRHAARLGYAWRRMRRDRALAGDSSAEIIFDLQAEVLQRLGQRLRPDGTLTRGQNLNRARDQVHTAADILARLASRASTTTTSAGTCSPAGTYASSTSCCTSIGGKTLSGDPRVRSCGTAPPRLHSSVATRECHMDSARVRERPISTCTPKEETSRPLTCNSFFFDFDELELAFGVNNEK